MGLLSQLWSRTGPLLPSRALLPQFKCHLIPGTWGEGSGSQTMGWGAQRGLGVPESRCHQALPAA